MKKTEIHFEDLWREAELLVETNDSALIPSKIKDLLDNVQDDPNKNLGMALLHISALSKLYNVNVFKALLEQLEELKIDKLE